MNRLFTVLLLIFFSHNSTAQGVNDWYEVEIILFEHLDKSALEAEQWPGYPGQPDKTDAIELIKPSSEDDDNPSDSDSMGLMQNSQFDLNDNPVIQAAEPESTLNDHSTQSNATVPPVGPIAYQTLPKEWLQLNSQFDTLNESERYRPILHLGWRQIIPNRSHPDRIHLLSYEAGEIELDANVEGLDKNLDAEDYRISTPATDSMTNEINTLSQGIVAIDSAITDIAIESQPTQEIPQLDGVLSLSRGRYLHVEADFTWRNPYGLKEWIDAHLALQTPNEPSQVLDTASGDMSVSVASDNLDTATATDDLSPDSAIPAQAVSDAPYISPSALPPEVFRVRGNLRLRSGEIHYLDHPMVSMLILFTPYAPPMEQDETNEVETFGVSQ